MARLRDPDNGCPWDLEQDFASLAPYAIEEAYEVQDAVHKNDMAGFKEELGDLLLQVVFQSQMAKEKGLFVFDDVAQAVADKMISRHPHIFGSTELETSGQVLKQWNEIKAEEKAIKGNSGKLLDDVPLHFPALMRAQKLQKIASKVGFDWPDASRVFDKIKEEIVELEQEITAGNSLGILEEYGDLLFAFVNLGRKLGIDTEQALQGCNQKFARRFNGIEDVVKKSGKMWSEYSLDGLEQLWNEQKSEVKSGASEL